MDYEIEENTPKIIAAKQKKVTSDDIAERIMIM